MQAAVHGQNVLRGQSAWLAVPAVADAMALLAELCRYLGDAAPATTLYELLLPYGRRCVMVTFGFVCMGSVAYYLGQLAAVRGEFELARHHYETALAVNQRIGAAPYVARTKYEYARCLLSQGLADGRDRAVALALEAQRAAREIGMLSLAEETLAL